MGLTVLALACLVGAAFAGPFQRQSQCATRCLPSENEKFNYEPGKKYVYDFEGVNQVIVAGEPKQRAQISGQAEIHVLTKCEMILKLKNVRIQQKTTHAETEELRQMLEVPLAFAFHDGEIEHVCPSEEDSVSSINIKKGILSVLINSMDNLQQSQEVTEVDSLGRCLTKYTVRNSRQTVIEKEKDLKSCTNRHSSITSLITHPYESPESAIHSAPIFPTDKLTCQQSIANGIMQSSKCKEVASIKPLGEKIKVIEFEGEMELKLSHVESAQNIRLQSIKSPQPLLYTLHDERSVEDLEQEVKELLTEKCSRTSIIDLSASKDFIFLVSSVKRLSYESIQRIYSELESGSLCSSKKVTDMFLDTLPMAGSDGAIRLMVDLIIQQKVTGLKAKLWSASLALVQHPSQESIQAVAELVKQQQSRAVLLGVSSMVYRYCAHHQCSNSEPVKDIITTLNQVLGQQCSYESESEAVAVLKAFGNMGQILHAEKNILSCARDNDKPTRVRLAAIDAFRRLRQKRPDELLQLYTNTQEDYEIRIAALSTVLKQADEAQILAIKNVAEHESHEQVSAYAGTLISNWNRTSSPLKQQVRRRLNEVEIETPQVGYWENSKNIELSTFSQTFNVGGGIETDIIHSPDSKIPRSVYTRFDLDVFNNHMNVFEIGLRAEGLEEAFRKLIGFHEEKQQRSPWNILRSTNDVEDDKLEAQFFFRTMNTEIADFAVSDLNGMGEMMRIADILNKLSHEKTTDFSHSFMFVNSKLVIPSVTGRSYSFGLTGSATVGLTAKSKVDIVNILSKSKNCDVLGEFKPSVNVELAATAGIHSDKPRPDVKIVTRVHSEAHIEAQFKIKDSHLGLVRLSVPSENIAYTKISTDVFEVDAEHEEKPVFESLEPKFDACLDQLEKPLGVSVCAKWEVPRPFISNSFPYLRGIGNIELAIKKTDPGMSKYELAVEIPRRKSSVMTYKASLDTPGSRVNRRFSANLEVRMPSRQQKQFSLNITSPFQSVRASANGSLTMTQDLIDSSLEFQAWSSKIYSIRASAPISESSTEKTYSPSIQVSISSQPLTVQGTISVSKGRKQQIAIDLKANKPTRKPLSLKGTIVKEGVLSTSKSAEWKLSSDIALISPIVTLNVRSSTEKQSKQFHKLSSAVTVDYQTQNSQRESVKLSANLQKSSSKISTVAQFETTKYPFANVLLTWNMQGKPRESMKNDITLRYGEDQDRNYINVLQSTRLPKSQPGECKLAVKAPQFNIDCDVTVTHDIQRNSRFHTEVDLRYTEDKHVKAKLYLDKLSQKPLKLKMKAEIQTPSRRMLYQDDLEEVSPNSYRGNAAFEWSADQRGELQYKYQKLSDRSKLHHEIETSLRFPSSRYQIKNKASIEISSQKVGIEGRVTLDRRAEYSLKAELNKRGASYVNLKVPKLEGNLKLVNDYEKKAADLDIKSSLFRRPRHVTATASLGLGSQKKLETVISFDADREPDNKLVFSSSFEKQSRNKFECKTSFQILDKISSNLSVSGDRSVYGVHEISTETRLLKYEPVGFTIRHEMRQTKTNVMVRYSKSQRPKIEFSFAAESSKRDGEAEISTSASLKSLDNSFQSKKWSYKGSYSRASESSMNLKYNTKLEWSPSKIYESEANIDLRPYVIVSKAYLRTPHMNFEKQSVGFTYRKSNGLTLASGSMEFANGKSMSISSELRMIPSDGLTSSLTVSSPFSMLRNAKVMLSVDNKPTYKSLKSTFDLNGSRKADVEFSLTSDRMTEVKAHMKSTFAPEVSAHIKCENSPSSFKYDMQIQKGASQLMSASLAKQESSQDISYTLHSSSQEKPLINMKMVKQISPESTKHKLEASGAFPEISLSIESSRKDKNSMSVAVEACHKKNVQSCYSVKGYHKALFNEENYLFYHKLTIDVEQTQSENSSPKSLASVSMISSLTGNDLREKFIVELKEKKIGYEVRLHHRENEQDHCSLDSHIFTLSSTIRVRGSLLYNKKSIVSDFEIVPDASVPSRKLGYELKKEMEGNEITGYFRLHHPEVDHPMQISGNIRREGVIPVSGKVRLNYAERGHDYVLEIVPETQGRRQLEMKAVTYKVYREDKSFEASAKLMKYSSSRESTYSYDWAYLLNHQQKQGKLSLKLSEKINGKPRLIEAELSTPQTSTKLSTRLTWESRIPTGMHLTLSCNNQNIYEADIKCQEECLYVEQQLKSRPFSKQEMCFLKQDNEKMTVFSIQNQYRQYKTVDMKVVIDPEQSHYAVVSVSWDLQRHMQYMNELKSVLSELYPKYFTEQDLQYIRSKVYVWNKLAEEIFWDTVRKVKSIYDEQIDTVKSCLRNAHIQASKVWDTLSEFLPLDYIKHEIYHPLSGTIHCLWQEYTQIVSRFFDEYLRAIWEKIIRHAIDKIRVYCPQDSALYEFADALEHMEVERMKQMLSSRVTEMKESVSQCLDNIHFPDIREFLRRLTETLKRELHNLLNALSEGKLPQFFVQYFHRLEEYLTEQAKEKYQAFMDWISKIFSHLESDEDFRRLKSFVVQCKEKLWVALKKAENFAESVWEPMCKTLMEYPANWIQERVIVRRFSPKEGNITVQIRHPLESKHIQLLKNIVVSVKNTINSV